MASGGLKSDGYARREEELAGWKVGIVSYRVGERWFCSIDNVSPGATIARAEGTSRDEAERLAIEKARARLERTRIQAI